MATSLIGPVLRRQRVARGAGAAAAAADQGHLNGVVLRRVNRRHSHASDTQMSPQPRPCFSKTHAASCRWLIWIPCDNLLNCASVGSGKIRRHRLNANETQATRRCRKSSGSQIGRRTPRRECHYKKISRENGTTCRVGIAICSRHSPSAVRLGLAKVFGTSGYGTRSVPTTIGVCKLARYPCVIAGCITVFGSTKRFPCQVSRRCSA